MSPTRKEPGSIDEAHGRRVCRCLLDCGVLQHACNGGLVQPPWGWPGPADFAVWRMISSASSATGRWALDATNGVSGMLRGDNGRPCDRGPLGLRFGNGPGRTVHALLHRRIEDEATAFRHLAPARRRSSDDDDDENDDHDND